MKRTAPQKLTIKEEYLFEMGDIVVITLKDFSARKVYGKISGFDNRDGEGGAKSITIYLLENSADDSTVWKQGTYHGVDCCDIKTFEIIELASKKP